MNSEYFTAFLKGKKDTINATISKLSSDLNAINMNEKKIRDELGVKKGDHVLITKLKDLLSKKGNVIMSMVEAINRMDNLVLLCDKMLFDNIIMWTRIVKNLKLIYVL